jgi:hypothetical protein
MKEIKVEIYGTGGIDCLAQCKFKRSCANHMSAGDFRSEGGFSPRLHISSDLKQVFCEDIDKESNDDKYEPCPIDHPGDSGMKYIKNGKLETYDWNG